MSPLPEVVTLRKARAADVDQIARLVNGYADEQRMLPRTRDDLWLALDDYVVAVDAHGRVLGCGALREYSPSVAEVVSIAVARDVQRLGVGGAIVRQVERLALTRGFTDVFLVTVTPPFFESLGYRAVARAAYPEKRCAHAVSLAGCERCDKVCMARSLAAAAPAQAEEIAAAA